MNNTQWDVNWSKIKHWTGIALCVFILGLLVADITGCKKHLHIGRVIDKQYVPPRTWVSVETYRNGKSSSTRLVTHHEPAHYYLYVQSPDDAERLSVHDGKYNLMPVGQIVNYTTYHGCITGWRWWCSLSDEDW